MEEAATKESESKVRGPVFDPGPDFPDLPDQIFVPRPHHPTIFWIGCSDGRVPEATILPGAQIFTQRNIANQFNLVDGNAMACLSYALKNLTSITHIMVVGHTDCGGVKACYTAATPGAVRPTLDSVVWKWLGPLRILAELFVNEGRTKRELTNENVKIQVQNVLSALQWAMPDRTLTLSGHVYNLDRVHPRLERVVDDIIYTPPTP